MEVEQFLDLLNLQKHLRYRGYDKLDLLMLDRLRDEVDIKVEQQIKQK